MEFDDIYEKAQTNLTSSLGYFNLLNQLFTEDVYTSMEQYKLSLQDGDNKEYFWFRALLRSFFSYVDGVIYTMKEIIVWAYERKEIELNEGEILLLKEQRPVFRRKKVELISSFNTFEINFDLSMIFFAQLFYSDYEVDKGNNNYNIFKKSLEIRHRVTHPKRIEDYLIPPEEAENLEKAIVWFTNTMSELMESCDTSFESH